jgi:hypothetical protein
MKIIFVGAALALLSMRFVVAADNRIDVSRVIDKDEAESILGVRVKNTTPRNVDGKDGYYSKCNYYSAVPGKSLVLRLHQAAAGGAIDPQKELELVAASSGSMKAVEGLGDKAQMFSGGGDSGIVSRVFMLYVVKGNAFIMIGLGGVADEALALEKARTIAQKILEHL